MIHTACHRAEVLAGAIALGESTDAERTAYRRHVSTCADCLRTLGGELEIERVMTRVASARGEESWEPDIRASLRERMNNRKRIMRFGLSTLGVCFGISIMIHLVLASGLWRIAPTLADPLVINYDGQRVVLERRSAAAHATATSPPRVLVTHNVVHLTRPAARNLQAQDPRAAARTDATATSVAYSTGGTASDNTPPWRRNGGDWRATSKQNVPHLINNNSEALTISPAYSVREAEPIGGDSAISPQVPGIAYAQGAEGTTVFQVSIDEHGIPTKCVITKGSGYLSLDDSVCKAAMKTRYTPRMVNGRPVPGVYQDAFSFHINNGPGE